MIVGGSNGNLTFNPPTVVCILVSAKRFTVFSLSSQHASVGDYVIYEFQQKNHSATQSASFFKPCTNNPAGFDSGL